MLNQIKNSPERSQNEAEQLSLAQYITQNSTGGKTLTFGNLLSFPLEGRMFYVQPLYVQADFVLRRWKEMVQADPTRATEQPYKAIAEGDEYLPAIERFQAEGDHSHDPDDDVAGDDPAVVHVAGVDRPHHYAELPARREGRGHSCACS